MDMPRLLSPLSSHRSWVPSAVGAFALTVITPLLQLLGASPEFFVAHSMTDMELIFSISLISLSPLLCFYLVHVVWSTLSPSSLEHAPLVAAIALVLALLVLKAMSALGDFSQPTLLVLYICTASIITIVLRGSVILRQSLALIGLLSVFLLPLFFFFFSGSSSLLKDEPIPRKTTDSVADSKPLLFFIFDKFPLTLMLTEEGKIDDSRFPNFAYLSESSAWYRNAKAVSPYTRGSVPAILSGQLPIKGKRGVAVDFPNNLFTFFAATHKVTAYESFTKLCPDSICKDAEKFVGVNWRVFLQDLRVLTLHTVLPQGLADSLAPPLPQNWAGFSGVNEFIEEEPVFASDFSLRTFRTTNGDRAIIDKVLPLISAISDYQLIYMHIENPHEPYKDLPGGLSRVHTRPLLKIDHSEGWPQDKMVATSLQPFMLQAMYIDQLLGEIISRLKVSGYWERSVLVVTSDHGASPVPGLMNRGFRANQRADNMLVPLFIRAKGMNEIVSDDSVYSVDILPTLLDLYGVSAHENFSGVSLLSADSEFLRDREPLVGGGNAVTYKNSRLIPFRDSVLPDSKNPYVVGLTSDFFGRPIDTFNVNQGAYSASLKLEPRKLSETLFLDTVTGRSKNLKKDMLLAVALNGAICGFGYVYAAGSETEFSIIIDPAFIMSNHNDLRMFEVLKTGALSEITLIREKQSEG